MGAGGTWCLMNRAEAELHTRVAGSMRVKARLPVLSLYSVGCHGLSSSTCRSFLSCGVDALGFSPWALVPQPGDYEQASRTGSGGV